MRIKLSSILLSAGLTAAAVLVFDLLLGRETREAPVGERVANPEIDRRESIEPDAPTSIAPREFPDAERTGMAVKDPSTAPGVEGALVEVSILREDSRQPLPMAEVTWWPRSIALDDDGFEGWLRRSVAEEHMATALHLTSNNQGRVRVPSTDRGFVIAASSADLWGCATFEARATEARCVLLAQDISLRVQVVDSSGTPVVDAPVALRQRSGLAHFDLLTARSTAPDGIAMLRHAGRFLRSGSAPNTGFAVAVQGLLDPPVERTIPRDTPSVELLQLVLEPAGACVIAVVDDAGQPVDGPFRAQLRFAESGAAIDGELLSSRTSSSVRCEHVTLGRELAVELTREGSGTALDARGPGPRAPGQVVELRVIANSATAILRGRVVDGAGNPVADAPLRARLEAGESDNSLEGAWSVRSDAAGRFSVEALARSEVPAGSRLAVHRLFDGSARFEVARRALPPELRAGSHDLGDFALGDAPLAVAGTVRDKSGHPIPGASVTPVAPIDAPQEGEEALWRDGFLAPAPSDAAGRFEIRGEFRSGRIALAAEKAGWIGDSVVVSAGEREVELVLNVEGAIEGSVLLDQSLRGTMVLVQASPLEPAPDAVAPRAVEPAVLGSDGRFSLRHLRAGTYSLSVIDAPTGSQLASVEGVIVQFGQTTRDPRLEPLDLRETCRALELELVDDAGDAVHGARAFSRSSDDASAKWVFAQRGGERVQILYDGRPVDVAISAPGFLRTDLKRVTMSQRIALRRAARVRLILAKGLRPPEPPLQLVARLMPVATDGFLGFPDSSAISFDANGELAREVASIGELRVELALTLREPSGSRTASVLEDDLTVIDVKAIAGEQIFEIEFETEKLEAAARELVADH